MRIIYRSLPAAFVVIMAAFISLPLSAQLTEHQKEEIREQAKKARAKKFSGPAKQLPVTNSIMQLPAPQIVNFTELANWDLAHPKTDFTKRNMEDHDGSKIPVSTGARSPPSLGITESDGLTG